MEHEIIDDIANIFQPDSPYFYADTFQDDEFKLSLLTTLFVSERIREVVGLYDDAVLKIAYISKDNVDFLTLKEYQNHNVGSQYYTVNFFFFDDFIDELIFDLIIYDNLCLEDLKDGSLDIETIHTPRLFLFHKDCDLKTV